MTAKLLVLSAAGGQAKFSACLRLRTWSDVTASPPVAPGRGAAGSCKSQCGLWVLRISTFKLSLPSFQGHGRPRVWGHAWSALVVREQPDRKAELAVAGSAEGLGRV